MYEPHSKNAAKHGALLRRLAKLTAASITATALAPAAYAQLPANQLPTGKQITQPLLGTTQDVGSLPVNIVLTPDGKYAIASDMGFREYLTCLNTAANPANGTVAGQLAQPITAPAPQPTDGTVPGPPTSKSLAAYGQAYGGSNGLYYGLAVAANTGGGYTVYAAQGTNHTIAIATVGTDGSITKGATITMKPGEAPAGLSLDSSGKLYVAVNTNNTGGLRQLISPGYMVVYDTTNPAITTSKPAPEVSRVAFNGPMDTFGTYTAPSNTSFRAGRAAPFTPTNFPYAIAALSNGSKVYVGSQRDGGIFSINMANPAKPVTSFIPTGSHPVSLLLNKAQTLLYVANAQDDSISQITTANDTVAQTISLRPAQAANIPGVTPTGLALSSDEKTLYATVADMNAVAVVGLTGTANATVSGYIPTGWYPSSVAYVAATANTPASLLVANAKGSNTSHVLDTQGSLLPGNGMPAPGNPNPGHIEDVQPAPASGFEDTYYAETIIEGNVQNIPVPTDAATLANDTGTVLANNNLGMSSAGDTLAAIGLKGSKSIQHVIYIVKENRTYDQILGDEPNGNGSSSLTLFPKTVTPNLHGLAERFILLDNFYDCAEVSGDGWNWSTNGIGNEFVIKNVPYQYSSRGRSYDFEGQVNNGIAAGFPASAVPGGSTVFPNGQAAFPDTSTPASGYIWDAAARAGLTFRNYGFFTSSGVANQIPDNYPTEKGLQPGGHYTGGVLNPSISGQTDLDFRKFDTNYADSDAPITGGMATTYPLTSYGQFNEPNRFAEWNREFQLMLAAAPNGASVPNLMTIKLMSDHTAGFSTGKPTPTAHVSDNDYGVAEVVQAVRNSAIWNSTAIFVIEDDAQNGPDHVDCHRSTCYVISPYVKKSVVDHSFHNTDSVLHSIELLLGASPLSQYDAFAPTFGADFATTPVNNDPFVAVLPPSSDIYQTASAAFLKANPQYIHLAKLSDKMNFSQEDLVPSALLNQIIWQSVKGFGSKMPAPAHHVFLARPIAKGSKAAKTTVKDSD